jgi:hypothetical protein
MRKTLTILFSGSALTFLFAYGGHWIVYSFVAGTGGSYKDDFITIQLIEIFVILPLMSLCVGATVGWFHERWWLAGVCFIPLSGYLLWQSRGGAFVLMLSLIYVAISLGVAFIVSRVRGKPNRSVAPLKEQV